MDDLYIVPPHWLSAVHHTDPEGRATLAASLVSADRRGSIEHLYSTARRQVIF